MEDRSKRNAAVRPQLDEHCGKQRECDIVLNTTSDKNNGELNGEDMEDGDTGFDDGSAQVRNIRDQNQLDCPRTPRAHDHTSTVQIMVQVLCDGARRERTAQEVGCSRRLGGSAARVNGLQVSWRGNLKSTCLPCWSSANGDTR